MRVLKGITWNHPRGYQPLKAAARVWAAEKKVDVQWDIRTLKEFGDRPIESLTDAYDLVIIDHPYVGSAAAGQVLLPLDKYLPAEFVEMQRRQSIGAGFDSYCYDGHCWALPIDAAAQVSAYRKDLVGEMAWIIPQDVTSLKDAAAALPKGRFIGIPLCPTDIWCVFLSLCASYAGGKFFSGEGIEAVAGEWALDQLRSWKDFLYRDSFKMNPVQMLEDMSTRDEIVYIPFTFGYSNYARKGWRSKLVHFGSPPCYGKERPTGLLGGAGIAVSAQTRLPAECLEFIRFILSGEVQNGLYFREQGQPAHRSAWLDPGNDEDCSGFFSDTLETLVNAYVRPRYKEFNRFQEVAARHVHEAVQGLEPLKGVVDTLNIKFQMIVHGRA
jgi:multiple sugar transport system substrate-binding protein